MGRTAWAVLGIVGVPVLARIAASTLAVVVVRLMVALFPAALPARSVAAVTARSGRSS